MKASLLNDAFIRIFSHGNRKSNQDWGVRVKCHRWSGFIN